MSTNTVFIQLYRCLVRHGRRYDQQKWKQTFLAHNTTLSPYIHIYQSIHNNNSQQQPYDSMLWLLSGNDIVPVIHYMFQHNILITDNARGSTTTYSTHHQITNKQQLQMQQCLSVLNVLTEYSSIGAFDNDNVQDRNRVSTAVQQLEQDELQQRQTTTGNNEFALNDSTGSNTNSVLHIPQALSASQHNNELSDSGVQQCSTGESIATTDDAQLIHEIDVLGNDGIDELDNIAGSKSMLYNSFHIEDTIGSSYMKQQQIVEQAELDAMCHNTDTINQYNIPTTTTIQQQQSLYGLLVANVDVDVKQRFIQLRQRLSTLIHSHEIDPNFDDYNEIDNVVFQLRAPKYHSLLYAITPIEWTRLLQYYESCIIDDELDSDEIEDEVDTDTITVNIRDQDNVISDIDIDDNDDTDESSVFDDLQCPTPASHSVYLLNAVECYTMLQSLGQPIPRPALRALAKIIEVDGNSSQAMILVRESAFVKQQFSSTPTIPCQYNQHNTLQTTHVSNTPPSHINNKYAFAMQHISYLLASTQQWINAAQTAQNRAMQDSNNGHNNSDTVNQADTIVQSRNTRSLEYLSHQQLLNDQWLIESAIIASTHSDFESARASINYDMIKNNHSHPMVSTVLYELMLHHNIPPARMTTYNALVWLYGRLGMIQQVQSLIDTLTQQNRQVSRVCYHALLIAHCMIRDIDNVINTLESMYENNIRPTQSALLISYMLACCTSNRVVRCQRIIDIGAEYDIDVNSISMQLIKELSLHGAQQAQLSDQIFTQLYDSVMETDSDNIVYNEINMDLDVDEDY